MMPTRKFVRCSTLLDRNAVSRKIIDGVEHIIISSFTMPDNIIMNGVLYPGPEIHASFEGLNRTLAPIGHPHDSDGNFLSASDPSAIANFYAGAFNDNVQRVGNRIKVDKTINVAEAKKSDRGKRLLDRISDLETNEDAKPIHTSTGLFLTMDVLDEPQLNESGQEFFAIAHDIVFDHDAILLDEIGAAQPSDGVGMAVNRSGEKMDTEAVNLDLTPLPGLGRFPDQGPQIGDRPVPRTGPSLFTLMEQLQDQGKEAISNEWLFVADLLEGTVIYQTERGYFESEFIIDQNERARLSGIPFRVDRSLTYQPKTNSSKGSVTMRTRILNALKEAGIDTKDLTDDQIFEVYNELMAPKETDEEIAARKLAETEAANKAAADKKAADDANKGDDDLAVVIANAVKSAIEPVIEKVTAMETKLEANANEDKAAIVTALVNSGKYPDMTDKDLSALSIDRLRELGAGLGSGYGLPPLVNTDPNNSNIISLDMPNSGASK